MVKAKRKSAARPRVNRLTGFSGTPTDEEIDELIDVAMMIGWRLITSLEKFQNMKTLADRFEQLGRNLGDA